MSSRTLNLSLAFALITALAAFALAALSPGLLNDGDTYWHTERNIMLRHVDRAVCGRRKMHAIVSDLLPESALDLRSSPFLEGDGR